MTNFDYVVYRVRGEDVLTLRCHGFKALMLGLEDCKARNLSLLHPHNEEYCDHMVGNIFLISVIENENSDLPRVVGTYKGKYEQEIDRKEKKEAERKEKATYYQGLENPDWNGLSASNVKCSTIYKLAEEQYGIKLKEGYTKASDKSAMIEEFKSYFSKETE